MHNLQHRRRRSVGLGEEKIEGNRWRGCKDIFDQKLCSPCCLVGIMLPMAVLMIRTPPHPCTPRRHDSAASCSLLLPQTSSHHTLLIQEQSFGLIIPNSRTHRRNPLPNETSRVWCTHYSCTEASHRLQESNVCQAPPKSASTQERTGDSGVEDPVQWNPRRKRRTHHHLTKGKLWLESYTYMDDSSMGWLSVREGSLFWIHNLCYFLSPIFFWPNALYFSSLKLFYLASIKSSTKRFSQIWLHRKVEKFRNPVIFWWHAKTYCLNLGISPLFFFPLRICPFWAILYPTK